MRLPLSSAHVCLCNSNIFGFVLKEHLHAFDYYSLLDILFLKKNFANSFYSVYYSFLKDGFYI